MKVISLRDVPTKVTFHTDKTLSTPHQRQFVLLFFPSPSTKICVHVIQKSRKDGEKKEKREVIRFKNSFFSVFLHGCHVPVVEVLCVSLLRYLLPGPSRLYPLLRRDGATGNCCKLLLILLQSRSLQFMVLRTAMANKRFGTL